MGEPRRRSRHLRWAEDHGRSRHRNELTALTTGQDSRFTLNFSWKRDRADYGTCLESKRGVTSTAGSNPAASANFMSTKAKRIGDVQKVINKNPHWAALTEYNHIRIQFPDGCERSLLLTDNELKRALERAKKNPEDLPKVSWLRDLLD